VSNAKGSYVIYAMKYVLEVNGQMIIYLRDVVMAVYATATWLAGCLSHAGIISKRLNLS